MEIPAQFIDEHVKTFQHQDSLPSLPQPSLDNTLDKYLDSVRAVATDEEYRQTEFVVQTFRTGLGLQLQDKLLQRTANQRNWLERVWEDKAYLEGRYPTAPLVNITGPGPYYHTVFPPKPGTQLYRAGMVLYASVLFWDLIRREKLRVDPAGKDTSSCMNQYRRLFNSCKRPGAKKDSLNFYFKTESEGGCPSHVVVICRGRFFKLDVLHPGGDLLTPPELETQLRSVRERCDRKPAGPGVGALTGDQRTKWAENRDHLLRLHPDHPDHLHLIESAIVGFVLDDREPADEHKLIHQGLAGDSTCRWFDKGVCQVIFKNGTVVSNCDHAPFDGIVYIFATYFGDLCLLNSGGKWKGSTKIRPTPPPRELVFHVDDKLQAAISAATTSFTALGDNIEAYNPIYKGYGKKLIRRFKLHPDTYVQLALQLAYYRMHRKPAPTYETGTVRRFWHGRTETVRSCTPEAVQWARAMVDPQTKSERKLALFSTAMKKHLKNMEDATFLKGCDRHLLALAVIAEEEGLSKPAIFTDPSFTKSGGGGNFILSTSFVGYTPVIGGCAPMCDHGYGLFYSIQPDQLTFFMTTWLSDEDTDARQLFASIAMSLNDMRQLLEEAAPKTHKL